MGCGGGYILRFFDGPSLYLTGDTVLTPEVRDGLASGGADVVVVHAGGASLDLGRPILMTLDEIRQVVMLTTGRVVAVHLEALNHCPITRIDLAEHLVASGLRARVDIPADGETLGWAVISKTPRRVPSVRDKWLKV